MTDDYVYWFRADGFDHPLIIGTDKDKVIQEAIATLLPTTPNLTFWRSFNNKLVTGTTTKLPVPYPFGGSDAT